MCAILRFYLLTVISPRCLWCLLKAIVDNKRNFPVMNSVRQGSLIEKSAQNCLCLSSPAAGYKAELPRRLKSELTKHFFSLSIPSSLCEFVVVRNPLTSSIFDPGCMFPEMSCLVSQGKTLMSTWFNIKGRDSKNGARCQRGNNIPVNEKL